MAIKPILFNTEMVQAILEGRKTQTRRLLKNYRIQTIPESTDFIFNIHGVAFKWAPTNECKDNATKKPFSVGDILWVRETWSTHYDDVHDDLQFCYKADGIDLKSECLPGENNRWYPSIHMPKEAARIFLKVKGVRVERLQDMGEEAAIAEGITDSPAGTASPLDRFTTLWDKTVKREDLRKYGWHANPWCWVIEFERCEKPEGWY